MFHTNSDYAQFAIALACQKQAQRPVIIDVRSQTSATEYFAIISAGSGRQVYAVADYIKSCFKKQFGLAPLGSSCSDSRALSTWILLDYGFMFVHVFQESTRQMYQLEQLWSKGLFVELQRDVYEKKWAELEKQLSSNDQDSLTSHTA